MAGQCDNGKEVHADIDTCYLCKKWKGFGAVFGSDALATNH